MVADTKHNLTVDPVGFLGDSLSMWSETMPLGQLQNQAYGYLFPQGAFFAAFQPLEAVFGQSHWWVVQALWWALTLCVAFTGFYKVAETFRIGTYPARVIAGLLFALSPRVITTLGAISSEAWTVAITPWILLPIARLAMKHADASNLAGRNLASRNFAGNTPAPSLRHKAQRLDLFVAVGLSGVAVLTAGAVNAVSTAAACIPAAALLLACVVRTWRTGDRGFWLTAAFSWLVSCAVVSIWWLVPLLLLGAYSPPFTDYIESSGVTTRWLGLGESLRGTTSWTPFVSTERVGGNALVSDPILIYATVAIAAIGLLGLAMRSMPWRRFFWLLTLLGVVVLSAWTTPFGSFADFGRDLLDGALAPLRNIHKFDAVLRLPLLLGFAHAIARLPWNFRSRTDRQSWLHPEKQRTAVAAMLVLTALFAATSPAWSARLAPDGAFTKVPDYWAEAADWLNENAESSRTLLLPSTPFAVQQWGNTRDEPLQPLADVPWVVRDAVPLVPPEAIRGLDGIRDRFVSGRGIDSLAPMLNNQGIGYVLVRYDLTQSHREDQVQAVAKTLHNSPGVTLAAEFVSDGTEVFFTREGQTKIEIYRIGEPENLLAPHLVDAQEVPLVTGGPEVLTRLDEIDHDAPVRLLTGNDAGTITDTPARRGRNYGEINGATSGILSVDEDSGVANVVSDYPVAGVPLLTTTHGGSAIAVSSSASDPYNVGGARTEHSVAAMLDGDPTTWWEPTTGTGQAEWVEITLEEPADDLTLELTGALVPFEVRIQGDRGSTSAMVMPGDKKSLWIPGGQTETVRITATRARLGFALAELRLLQHANTPAEQDLTPIRVPTVPDSSLFVGRWSFGQEIYESTMVRLFHVPRPMQVRADSNVCRSSLGESWTWLDGSPDQLACGEEFELTPGWHRLQSKAQWVSVTDINYRQPARAQQNITTVLDDEIAASDVARILWRPMSVNQGMVARIGGAELEPITVNGWQQGWLVPEGIGGALTIEFEPASTWRFGIIAGGIVAAVFAVAVLGLVLMRRRLVGAPSSSIGTAGAATGAADSARDDAQAEIADKNSALSWPILAATLLAVALVSSWPGLIVAGVVFGGLAVARRRLPAKWLATTAERPSRLRRMGYASLAVLLVLAAGLMADQPWPNPNYAAGSWTVQLLFTAALALVGYLNAWRRD